MLEFLLYLRAWLRRPGPMYVTRSEFDGMKMICEVSFPAVVAPDTAKRTLTIQESEKPDVVVDITPITLPNYQFRVERDANVTLSLVDTDASGNASAPQTKVFTATDTVPPPMPGEMNVAIVGQEN